MGSIESEGIFDGPYASGQAAVVASEEFAEGRRTDQALKCVSPAINRIAVALIEVGSQVTTDFAIAGQHPRSQLGVLAFLTLTRTVMRGLVEERGELGEALTESRKLILSIGNCLCRQCGGRTACVNETVDADTQRSCRSQEILCSSASSRSETLIQASPPEC